MGSWLDEPSVQGGCPCWRCAVRNLQNIDAMSTRSPENYPGSKCSLRRRDKRRVSMAPPWSRWADKEPTSKLKNSREVRGNPGELKKTNKKPTYQRDK